MFAVSFFVAPFSRIAKHRQILYRTTLVEMKSAYAGSLFGLFWYVLGPVLLFAVYALVYAVIFRIRPAGMLVEEYVLYVFSGLVPFLSFSAALTAGSSSLITNKQALLNTVFPSELIPVRSVVVASASLLPGIIILLLGDIAFSRPSLYFSGVIVTAVLQVLFVIGLSWILSLATLLIRDIQQMLSYIVMLLLIISPIAYTPEMIPSHLKAMMYLNPLYYFVINYQSFVILNQAPPLYVLVMGAVMSVAVFCGGYLMYQKAKQVFYEFA